MIGTTMLLKSQQVSIFLVVSCSRENRFLHMVAPSLSPESVKLILCNFRKTALRTRLSVFLAILSLHQLGERSMIGHNRLLSHNDLTFFFPSDLSFTDSGITQTEIIIIFVMFKSIGSLFLKPTIQKQSTSVQKRRLRSSKTLSFCFANILTKRH